MIEIWLLETSYEDGESYEEIFMHIPDTDVWITDDGYKSETLSIVRLTPLFWKNSRNTHWLTKLGVL